jgi:hypothetical protein
LLTQFESLGENCELAFVQSHLGTEPLGLLRWSGIELPALIQALDLGLSGIGDEDNTDIQSNTASREYFVTDRRYGMMTHTAIFEHQEEPKLALERFCRRTRFLRDKLLDDLRDDSKVFVRQSTQPMTLDEILTLQRALRRIGPSARLLYIRPAAGHEVAGTVEILGDGLFLGLIDRPGLIDGEWTISYRMWLILMMRTLELCSRPIAVDVDALLVQRGLSRREAESSADATVRSAPT